jgi:hypothetical protein
MAIVMGGSDADDDVPVAPSNPAVPAATAVASAIRRIAFPGKIAI